MDLLRGYGETFVCEVALGEGCLKWKIRREESQPHRSRTGRTVRCAPPGPSLPPAQADPVNIAIENENRMQAFEQMVS
jgi:hypothetical protein